MAKEVAGQIKLQIGGEEQQNLYLLCPKGINIMEFCKKPELTSERYYLRNHLLADKSFDLL